MTHEEAIKIINSDLNDYGKLQEARTLATIALKQQTPKRARALHKVGVTTIVGYCNCGSMVNNLMRYCVDCGQAIDWSWSNLEMFEKMRGEQSK